mgnify:CR=1 FL=1
MPNFNAVRTSIEAMQFNRNFFKDLEGFTKGQVSDLEIKSEEKGDAFCILRRTDYGDIRIQEGDYVAKSSMGRFYAMKPDVFLTTYAPEVILGVDCK